MLLLAALALSASLEAEVPFLPQTPDLCGGAAVAMVFRYWGDTQADVQQFAPLVDRKAGGIAQTALVAAVRERGWQATAFTGSVDALRGHLGRRQPIVVLLHDRGRRYHYVVVTAVDTAGVTVHDPSWGPSRLIRHDEFARRWGAARFWSLAIVPGAARIPGRSEDRPLQTLQTEDRPLQTQVVGDGLLQTQVVGDGLLQTQVVGDGLLQMQIVGDGLQAVPVPVPAAAATCDGLLDAAITDMQQRGLHDADAILGRVRAECPASAGPLRELAGVRFAERRWNDAAALARQALALDPNDGYAIDVLGSSLFMLDDATGALRVWNRIGKPRLDTVRIEGLHHTRYDTVAAAVAPPPHALLTPEMFALATRRVNELPDRSSARLTLRPDADGTATLDAAIAERQTLPRGIASWTGSSVRAAVDREAGVSIPGFSGQGDVWSARWRWWEHRPRVAFGVAAPRVAGLPGVWRVDASWERETYRLGSTESPALLVQSHTHGGLAVSDWITSNVRYSVGGGLDAWDTFGKAASIGGSLERRLFEDRVSLGTDATAWMPLGGGRAFSAFGAHVSSTSVPPGGDPGRQLWAYATRFGVQRVSNNAPLGLWPGAGDGHARAPLLRAHPLLDDGIIDMTGRSAFGRTIESATLEGQRWFGRPALVHLGVAAFADMAIATRAASERGGSSNVDVGGGVRVRLPGSARVIRIDLAYGLSDHANALTLGWLF